MRTLRDKSYLNEGLHGEIIPKTREQFFVLRNILQELYKSLKGDTNYLAAVGIRTALDRAFYLKVGDKGNFADALVSMESENHITLAQKASCDVLIDAGNASAHRGWAPDDDTLISLLELMEGIVFSLFIEDTKEELIRLKNKIPQRPKKKKRK